MSRGAKVAIGLTVAVVGLNAALSLLHALLGGTPGGPPSSSYATGADGVAAYASLLARAGHPVERLRSPPAAARLSATSTLLLLDPVSPVTPPDATALGRFVAAGGDLVVGGATGAWLGRIVPGAPTWSAQGVGATASVVAPIPALTGIERVDSPGAGSWRGGGALPLLGSGDATLLALARVGSGRVWLLADTAPLRNDGLASADDAALGLALAGARTRPVVFLESYHGYGAATGYAAVPVRWWAAFALLGAAALTLMLASGRRLGPPQAPERLLPPPRRDYVESLGGVLARTRPRDEVAAVLRDRARALVTDRAGLGATASDGELALAAARLGALPAESELLTRPVASDADLVALGRMLVRLRRESPR